MRIVFFFLSALFLFNAVSVSFTMRFSVGLFLVYAFGFFFLCSGIFYPQLATFYEKGVGFFIKRCLQIGFAAFFALNILIGILGKSGNITCHEKAIVVLGAGLNGEDVSSTLRHRLDAAYLYHLQNPTAYIIVTGGQGPTEIIPEAIAMKNYLLAKGVPPALILVEDQSTNTHENFLFAIALLEEKGISTSDAIVFVSNRFHNYRAGLYAQKAGFTNTTALASSLPVSMVLPCYFRETVAVIHYWLVRQFSV